MTDSFFDRTFGQTPESFGALSEDQRAAVVREKIPDLHFFFDEGVPIPDRSAPPRTLELARSLGEALAQVGAGGEGAEHSLPERIVTDTFLRAEADRDQNVYFGRLFTRVLTHAVPDLIFQPVSLAECACALRWGREKSVPVTLRGAASTAMGGSVPNDGGLTIDLSRLDSVDIIPESNVCVVGAGARLRSIHSKLAALGLALKVYPSNLGGTLIGWFVTGGIGMNAFGHGRAIDSVRAADTLLPAGEHVRFHDDGRLDVPGEDGHRRTLSADETGEWFSDHGYPAMALADLAGSEGALALVLHLTVAIEKRPEIGAFLLAFSSENEALEAASWAAREGAAIPTNLKFLSASHMHHSRRVWEDEDAKAWRRHPGALSSDAHLPWTRITGPADLGVETVAHAEHAGAYLFVDFLSLDDARAFATTLGECPSRPHVLGAESVRFAAERFRPQQTKRLGPGLLAAEILMPADEVPRFLPRARELAGRAGIALDTEVYFLADGTALVIAGYLTDHRRGSFALDLVIAPALLDLAMTQYHGSPYVLGRWQSAYFARKFGNEAAVRIAKIKRALDPNAILSRGVLTGLRLRGVPGAIFEALFKPGIGMTRAALGMPALAGLVRALRATLAVLPGPARGRGEPADVAGHLPTMAAPHGARPHEAATPSHQAASARALNCVNCGECNSVCPIYHESGIRLPQMLTHAGESMHAGGPMPETVSTLLDLCMRCGNCEEVCQAGIPHLPLYDRMQRASNETRPHRHDRHVALLAALRSSKRYLREFLDVRPGGYVKRAPASLAGMERYVLLRAENDAGPAATCIHCGACVAVCPTEANHAFDHVDPRRITTDQERCIGCGTCVEVCPANHANGGQTLRVMEAPTRDWFAAIEEFEQLGGAATRRERAGAGTEVEGESQGARPESPANAC